MWSESNKKREKETDEKREEEKATPLSSQITPACAAVHPTAGIHSVINPTETLSRLFILTQSYSPFQTALSHTEAQEELKVSRWN